MILLCSFSYAPLSNFSLLFSFMQAGTLTLLLIFVILAPKVIPGM